MSRIRNYTQDIARQYKMPVADVLELYDGFVSLGMYPMDAAVKALAIVAVVSGDNEIPLFDDPEVN